MSLMCGIHKAMKTYYIKYAVRLILCQRLSKRNARIPSEITGVTLKPFSVEEFYIFDTLKLKYKRVT